MRTTATQGRLRVAFAGAFAVHLAPPVQARLRIPCDVILDDEAGVGARLADVDVLVSMAFTQEMGRAATRLKLVQVPGAGLERIDRVALPIGTWLANVYGHETGIAEYVFGAMLTLTRDFTRLDAALRRGIWESQWAVDTPPPPVWPELAGKTLGILGYGRIGQGVARRARAFDMQVCAVRRHVARSAQDALTLLGGPEIMDEVLQRADYLLIALPLTPETRGLLGAPQFHAMRSNAVLVNVSRAEILDEAALYHALAARRIAGAALDVWYHYPSAAGPTRPARLPFHELPNVLMTPHVSGWTEGTLEARAQRIAENIHRVAQGKPPVQPIPVAVE